MWGLPTAEVHRLEAGHFAVEDCLEYITEKIQRSYSKNVLAVQSAKGD
jgi:hypothetical protein